MTIHIEVHTNDGTGGAEATVETDLKHSELNVRLMDVYEELDRLAKEAKHIGSWKAEQSERELTISIFAVPPNMARVQCLSLHREITNAVR